jgi:hypothetical protein
MNKPRHDGRGTLPVISDVSASDVVIDKLIRWLLEVVLGCLRLLVPLDRRLMRRSK